ncbi:MAG: tetratricopeptide repeat protein [Paludibacteraceae bacterium]
MKHQLLYIFLLSTLFVSANTYNQQFLQAVMEGNEQIALECLQQGADINALDENGLALMHRCAFGNNDFMMQWLIDQGADINVLDFEGSTPLMYAVSSGYYRLVYKMLNLGADKHLQNHKNQTALTLAEKSGFLRMVTLLKNPKSYSEQPTTLELWFQREEVLQKGEWDKAITLARQEQKQASKEWSVTSPYYTRGLSDEGLIYIQLGRFEEADKALRRALKHTEKYNPNSEIYYFKLTGLAFLYSQMSRHTEAIQIYNECIEHIELFKNPQTIWQLYNSLAVEYTELGEYNLAEYNYQKALQYVDQLPTYIRTSAYCITKGNIASAHYFQNTPSAIKLFANEMKDVLQVMEKYQLFDQNYIRFKHTICDYYIGFGYLEQATKEIEELKSITKKLLGEEHDDYLSALTMAGRIAFEQNNYQVASLVSR